MYLDDLENGSTTKYKPQVDAVINMSKDYNDKFVSNFSKLLNSSKEVKTLGLDNAKIKGVLTSIGILAIMNLARKNKLAVVGGLVGGFVYFNNQKEIKKLTSSL